MSSNESGGTFGSFDALRKATQSDATPDPTPKAPGDEKGWTLFSGEDEEYELTEEELAALPPLEANTPGRISNRPPGFGPMDTGPACYRDSDSEELGILRSFRLRTIFPQDVLDETRGLPANPRPEDLVGRLDLRDQLIFTIDGADAKDYDDAVQIEPLGDGGFKLGVHIADVSHYVREGSILDDEALTRGTSVYLADQVVPMLPEELSNGLDLCQERHSQQEANDLPGDPGGLGRRTKRGDRGARLPQANPRTLPDLDPQAAGPARRQGLPAHAK